MQRGELGLWEVRFPESSPAAMTIQEQSGGIRHPSAILTGRDELSLGASLRSLNTAIQLKEPISCRTDYSPKVRKPYTITKQREKWTEEEHKKFLEALKLYGRAWRRIEEHVGTKTTIQIRSHAQKVFSKVVRDSSTGSLEPIEIPPPRPKRKPMHPYPRKLVDPLINTEASKKNQQRSPSPNSSVSEQEQQSPTSVLSAVGSGSSTPSHIEEIGFSSPPPVANPLAIASIPNEKLGLFPNLCQSSKDEAEEASVCARRIKLFGTMLLVSNAEEPAPNTKNVEPLEMLPWLTLSSEIARNHVSLHCDSPDLDDVGYGELHINGHLDEMKSQSGSKERELNQGRNARHENQDFVVGPRVILSQRQECNKGFVPYKRLIASNEGAVLYGEDSGEKQRIQLCL